MISDSVLFIYGCLVRRPVVGYLNRPEMASNRLCNTSIIIDGFRLCNTPIVKLKSTTCMQGGRCPSWLCILQATVNSSQIGVVREKLRGYIVENDILKLQWVVCVHVCIQSDRFD